MESGREEKGREEGGREEQGGEEKGGKREKGEKIIIVVMVVVTYSITHIQSGPWQPFHYYMLSFYLSM